MIAGFILWTLFLVVVVANLWLRSQKKKAEAATEKRQAQRRAFRGRGR